MITSDQALQKINQNKTNLNDLKDFFKSNVTATAKIDENLINLDFLQNNVAEVLQPEYRSYPNEDKRLKKLIDPLKDNINYFIKTFGSTQDPSCWSLGRIPVSSDIVIIHHDAVAYLEGVNYGYIWRVDGTLTNNSKSTLIQVDTLFTMPESTLNLADKAIVVFETLNDINSLRDPYQISRGLITQGKVNIVGRERVGVIALAEDVKLGDSTLKLGTRIYPQDFQREMDWRAEDDIIVTSTALWGNAFDGSKGRIGSYGKRDQKFKILGFSADGKTISVATSSIFDHTIETDSNVIDEMKERTQHIPSIPGIPQAHEWFGKPLVLNFTRSILFESRDLNAPRHRRPHVCHLGDDVNYSWVEHRGFGRTDSTVLSPVDYDVVNPHQEVVSSVAPKRNIWGRFPIFIDRFNDKIGTGNIVLQGNTVWEGYSYSGRVEPKDAGMGSPGNGIVVLGGKTKLYENITHNTIGSGIAYISGYETGECSFNKVINVWGQVKDGADPITKAGSKQGFNQGRTGEGIFTASRMLSKISQNIVCSADSVGFVNLTRASTDGNPKDDVYGANSTPEWVPFRYLEWNDIDINPIHLEGLYVIATPAAYKIVKAGPKVNHGYPAVIKNIIGWEVAQGAQMEYTGEYSHENLFFVGYRKRTDRPSNMEKLLDQSSDAFSLGPNCYGNILLNSYFARFTNGVNMPNILANVTPPATQDLFGNFSVNSNFYNVTNQYHDNKGKIFTLPVPIKPTGVIKVNKPSLLDKQYSVTIGGTMTDQLGSNEPWPRFNWYPHENQDFTIDELGGIITVMGGYHIDLDTGNKFVYAKRAVRLRPTKEITEIMIPVMFTDAALNKAKYHLNFDKTNIKVLSSVSINAVFPSVVTIS